MKYNFINVSDSSDCKIKLIDGRNGMIMREIHLSESDRIGKVYVKEEEFALAADQLKDSVRYCFVDGDSVITDPRGRAYITPEYGYFDGLEPVYSVIPPQEYDWKGDVNPRTPYKDSFIYCCHVRGFTAHASSRVKHKGTFLGIAEKVDYLSQLGVTAIELQPAYEFAELEYRSPILRANSMPVPDVVSKCEPYINYWGYKRGYYYAPKYSYSCEDPIFEFKEMVRTLHAKGIEVIMQIYWPSALDRLELRDVLRFWVKEYHVDGFHLLGEDIYINDLAKDPMLSCTKLMYYGFDIDGIYGGNCPKNPVLATYRDDYLYTARGILKGDEGLVPAMLHSMRHIPLGQGIINYITNYYGFTMMDLVSYDQKHNEVNGENNRDGNDYNCSWNCGEEGPTRKKKIKELRLKQYKNAMTLLFMSQGTPLIFMGDEFGNSQSGNNNPYDQDNETTWLDWRNLTKNKELFDYVNAIFELRQGVDILHPARELRMMDVDGCGYPDLSYHGEQAWRVQTESYSRCFGQMYCSKEKCLYIAVNLHWESHAFGLPKLSKNLQWRYFMGTSSDYTERIENDCATVEARSIVIFEASVL